MKRIISTIVPILISAFVSYGQGQQKYTSIKELIQKDNHQTYFIKAHFAGIYDSSQLTFFVEENDYIIPVRLQKRDLGAEKRFLNLNLQEGDVVTVKGMLNNIIIDGEKYKGLVDALLIDENVPEEAEVVEEEVEEEAIPFLLVEQKPSFNGGDANEFSNWVNSHLEYPKLAKENGVQGRVTLQFTIETDGRITNIVILRGVDESLDKEAVRVVSSSPRWKPGTAKGKPVRVTYTFPVIFQLR